MFYDGKCIKYSGIDCLYINMRKKNILNKISLITKDAIHLLCCLSGHQESKAF
jgi:hypothetical protein